MVTVWQSPAMVRLVVIQRADCLGQPEVTSQGPRKLLGVTWKQTQNRRITAMPKVKGTNNKSNINLKGQ